MSSQRRLAARASSTYTKGFAKTLKAVRLLVGLREDVGAE